MKSINSTSQFCLFSSFCGIAAKHQPVFSAGAVLDGELTKVDATAKTLSVRIPKDRK